jgi:hypothetical protein
MKYLKHITNLAVVAGILFLSSCSGMYDNIDKYSGEVVYPGTYDTISAKIGYERVEIDLMQEGRILSNELFMGKAVSTIVEYDGKKHYYNANGEPVTSSGDGALVSWVNVTGLTEPKLYRFKVYTEDKSGNQSVPHEIAVIPYSSQDRDLIDISSPRISTSPSAAIVDWPNGLNSVVMDYYSLTYSYVDKDGEERGGEIAEGVSPRFYVANLASGSEVIITVTYRVVPILSDGETRILDTIPVTKEIVINIPTDATVFSPSEETVLRANGITTFTAVAVASVNKLVFPLHISSIQDIFYFPNLRELDLTGEGLEDVVPTFRLAGNGGDYTKGGGAWIPCIKRSENQKTIAPPISGLQSLIDLLEADMLTKIRYIPNSLGLDDILSPYVESGVVELVTESFYPQEVMLPYQFWMEGRPQTGDFRLKWNYPVSEASVPFAGNLIDPTTVYEVIPDARNATFTFILPKEYIWDLDRYRYFKFKVLPKSAPITFSGSYDVYLKLWMRPRTRFWGVDAANDLHGENKEYNYDRELFKISASAIQTSWTEFTVDMKTTVDNTKIDSGHHIRCIVVNLGGEQGPNPWVTPPNGDMEYYFADFRLSKTN